MNTTRTGTEREVEKLFVDKVDITPKPSVIISIYDLEKSLRRQGLDTDDILILIQRRTRPRIPLKYIKTTLEAAKKLEKSLQKGAKE